MAQLTTHTKDATHFSFPEDKSYGEAKDFPNNYRTVADIPKPTPRGQGGLPLGATTRRQGGRY